MEGYRKGENVQKQYFPYRTNERTNERMDDDDGERFVAPRVRNGSECGPRKDQVA